MTDTYTERLRLVKQQTATNRLVWGSILNSGLIDLLDSAIAGAATIDVSAANVTLSMENGAVDEARCMTLLVTGAPGVARTIFVPTAQKVYTVHNASGQTVTVRTVGGSGVAVLNGTRATLFVDETLDEVFRPALHPSQSFAPDTGTMDPIACAVTAATGGTTTPTFYRHREGDHISISCGLISVDVASTAFIITGSFFTGLDDNRCYPQYILEAGAPVKSYVEIRDGSIIITRADLGPWTNPSTRVIPAMTFSFRGTTDG